MSFDAALAQFGAGPLTEAGLRAQVWPLFSRVLGRSKREIYLANHSLGRPLDRAAKDVAAAMDAWYRDLDGAWGPWLEARERQRALTAKLVGAPRADSIIPKTSAGQGLRAVLNALDAPLRVVSTEGEFDSLDFILRAYRERGRIALAQVAAGADGRFHVKDLIAALRPGMGAQLLVLSTVMFRTAQVMQGVPDLVRAAHAAGAMVLLDLYHHAAELVAGLARRGVNGDARGDLLRLCPDILNTEEELARAARALKDAHDALA